MIGKTRHAGTSCHQSVDGSTGPSPGALSDSEVDPEKENHHFNGNNYRNKSLIESSDDDFDQCELSLTNATFNIILCDDTCLDNVSFPSHSSCGTSHPQS